MPFWRVYYHLVWATKNRLPLLKPEVEQRLYPYLISKASELGAQVYAANGWNDHVHLVTSIPPKHAVATFVKQLKGASSFHLNNSNLFEYQFNWQRGYGVFSLGESQLGRAIDYVRSQKEHHSQQTTNSWLERSDEFDDGPPEFAGPDYQIREEPAMYNISCTDQFP